MKYYWCVSLVMFAVTGTALKLYTSSYSYNWFSNVVILLISAITAHIVMWIVNEMMPRTLLQDLNQKAVLITGCDSGFGNMCAKRLDSLGVTVYAGCLFPEGDGAKQLKSSTSSRLHIVPLDVTKEEDATKAVQYVKDTIADKTFWCVLNNSGILSDMLLEHNSVEDVRKVMEVNAIGAVNVTQKFLPMLKEASGRVVCTISILGRITLPFFVPYSMSKYALLSYVEGLRREMQLTSGVTVHGIEPSTYRTTLTDYDVRISALKQQLAANSHNVQEEDKCIKQFKASFGRIIYFTKNSNVNEVIDCMVDAAVGTTPKMFYRPNLRCHLEMFLCKFVPVEVIDGFFNKVVPLLAPELLRAQTELENKRLN